MYTSFFGFACKPFQLTPDPEFLFLSKVHKRALTYLRYGIADNSGFILLTGEIGAGKTTIIRKMLTQIPQDIKLARVNNTKVSSDQLISMINDDFGLDTTFRDKTRMLSDLTEFLIAQYAAGGRAMIIIDEAQNLSPDLLEEIRLLSNLETDKAKLLQIVLIGQPELNVTLSRQDLDQLRQRIAVNTYIGHLSRGETEEYIKHRLTVAGNADAVRFGDGVMDEIYDFSKGIPRLINILCEFTLLAAFADERKVVDLDLIREIANDLVNERPETRAALARSHEPMKQEFYGNVKKAFRHCHERLRKVETTLLQMQGGSAVLNDEGRQLSLREVELNRREDDLLRREYSLIEKEEALREKEERMNHILAQNGKEVSPQKAQK